MPAWGPPQGDEVQFPFVVAWSAPAGNEVAFAFAPSVAYVYGSGFVSSDFGTLEIALDLTQFLYSSGFESSGFGALVATPGAVTLSVPGADYSVLGTHVVFNFAQYVELGGIAPPPDTGPNSDRQLPSPTIEYRTKILDLDTRGIGAPAFPTTHYVAFYTQYVDLAGRGPDGWASGTPQVAFAVRYIEPPFIASNVFGSHVVARTQSLTVTGWESSFISTAHELAINLQRLLHHSGVADQAEYGDTHVRNQHEILQPQTILSGEPGFPIVYNLDRYLLVQPYMDTNSDPTGWPDYGPFVENRNRVLGPSGWQSSRFSIIGNFIENAADPVYPAGLDATLWGQDTFVSHYTRYVDPASWEEFHATHYTIVYNDARVISATGWGSSTLGIPAQVINLNREVRQHTGWVGYEFGTPFAAYAVRTVFQGVFNDVPSGFPTVRLNPYPIAPVGIDSYRTGGHDVAEHFNIVFAHSTNVHPTQWVGEPIVENRNKTLRVFPSDQSLFGLARVYNYDTHITITAGDLSVWGSHLIRDRTLTIVVAPASIPVIAVSHRVRNDTPDPPATQRIEPESVIIGLLANPGIVSEPVLSRIAVFPDGIAAGAFGAHAVSNNMIRPGSIIDLAQVGTPTLLFTQFLFPFGLPWPRAGNENADGSMGESDLLAHEAVPRFTPHTVYAPAADQATAQARRNHPPNTPHAIDAFTFPDGNRLGMPIVSNQNREIGPVPVHPSPPHSSRFGDPTLTLSIQYVYPFPLRSLRTGLPVILNVPQYITFEWYGGWLSEEIGDTTVAHAVIRYMPTPGGFESSSWGAHTVDLFNREVAPQGIPHRGNPQEGFTNPWGEPLVGFPRMYTVGGLDATLWSLAHRVEHRIRSVYPSGWDSYADTQDDLSGWSDRMRVRRTNPPGGLQGIAPSTGVGTPDVSHYTRTVFSRGPSGYASGWHRVTATAAILPSGWDSLEVGDIDEWEEGKIKPHGDDLSSVGIPRMGHPLYPGSFYDHAIGDSRVGSIVHFLGIPAIGFDGPSVTDEFGCNNRVVTPLPVLSQQVVPQPVVTL
jgi:hypothetical protein